MGIVFTGNLDASIGCTMTETPKPKMDAFRDNAAGLDGLGQLRSLKERGLIAPIAETMGFRLIEVEPRKPTSQGDQS